MILLSHPTGNSPVRQTLLALKQEDLLESFHTTIGFNQNLIPHNIPLVSKTLKKRSYPISQKKIKNYPSQELYRLFRKTLRNNGPQSNLETYKVYKALDKSVSKYILKKKFTGNLCLRRWSSSKL